MQAAIIQHDLAQVGISMDIRSYEFATLYADVLRGSFQMYTLQWVGVSDPDMLRRVFHSRQMPPVGSNRGFYANPAVDQAIDRATVATDREVPRAFPARISLSPGSRRVSHPCSARIRAS